MGWMEVGWGGWWLDGDWMEIGWRLNRDCMEIACRLDGWGVKM